MRNFITLLGLFFATSVGSQSFWDISVGYRMPVNKNSIHQSGHGIAWDFYFFPLKNDAERKVNFAILGGWTWKDRLWNNKFNKDFASNYKSNLNRTDFSGLDSLGVARLANEIEGYHGWEIPLPSYHNGIHERSFYAGFQFFIEGGIRSSFKFYVGNKVSVAGIDYDSLCVSPGSSNSLTSEFGYFYFKRPLFFGGEISLQPFSNIFKNEKFNWKQVSVSFFYEYADFTKSKFKYHSGCETTDYIPFDRILPSDILSRYKKDVRFGLRLGIFLVR